MRLMSCRFATGETLGVVEAGHWLPAATILADGARTITDLLAAGPGALAAGDRVTVEIEGIGVLENVCRFGSAEETAA